VLWSAFKSTGSGGGFDFAYASIDLATFTLPDIELISIEPRIPDPTISFGSSVMEDGEYIYIYGAEKVGINKFAHVARAPGGDMRNPWEYYDGAEWVSDLNASFRLMSDVSEQFAVFKSGDGYYMVTQHHIFGSEIYLWEAPAPEGPWTYRHILYCTPESGGNLFTYNAWVHPQFSSEETILVSYNINSFNFGDLFTNADNYRPYFFEVTNWK